MAIRKSIAVACRILEREGQADLVWGHVSMRDPAGRGVWLKGSNLGFDEVEPTDVILLSWDGEILEGSAGRHIEYHIHTEIMKCRPDVNAIVHSHPTYSIAFAATGWPLKALSHEGGYFVPPDIARFTRTHQTVDTVELGEALAECLGERNAVLMPGHGITVVGGNIGEAVGSATHLERACRIALLAGEHAIGTSDSEAIQKRQTFTRRMAASWDYFCRRAAKEA